MEDKRLTKSVENIMQQFENTKPENRNKFCLEHFSRLAELEDKIENGIMIELPCKIGDTVYKIKKACDDNICYKDEYKCSPEFSDTCRHYMKDYDGIYCTCKGNDWINMIEYCNINTAIYCNICKERLCIQKDIFTYDKIDKMYNKSKNYDDYYNIFFTTKEQAEAKLKELEQS